LPWPFSATVASNVEPSQNSTTPTGNSPVSTLVTATVDVTGVPAATMPAAVLDSAAAVLAGLTDRLSGFDVAAWKFSVRL
jgi:hypothetical protein